MEWNSDMAASVSGFGGALIGAIGGYGQQEASARAAKRMYKHRYQWQVADMKKAGINPMLAFSQGAPVPQTPQTVNVGEAALRGASSATATSMAVRVGNAQIANLNSNSAKNAAETDLANASAQNIRGQTGLQPTTQALNEALTAEARQRIVVGVHSAEKMRQETSNLVVQGLFMGAQMALVGAQTETEKVRARLVLEEIGETVSRTGKNLSEIRMIDLSREKMEKLLPGEYASQLYDLAYKGYGIPKASKEAGFYNSWMGTADPYIKSVGGVADVVGKIFGLPASAMILRGGMNMPSAVGQPSGMGGFPYK